MGRRRWHLYVVVVLVIMLTMGIFVPALASIDDARDELKEIQDERKEREAEQRQAQTDMGRLSQELSDLEETLDAAGSKLRQLNSQVNKQQALIKKQEQLVAETERSIQETELFLEAQTEYLETRLRTMYKNGVVSYLEVLFSASSFIDFLSRLGFLQSIIQHDVELVDETQLAREALAADKLLLQSELELQIGRRKELAESRAQAKKEESAINNLLTKKASIAGQLQQEINQNKVYIAALAQEEHEMQTLIKRLEEEERKRAEQGSAAPPPSPGSFHWPVPGTTYISSPFGPRWGSFHYGIDIAPSHIYWPGSSRYQGTPAWIVAAAPGKVEIVSYSAGGYGWWVAISHSGGFITRYAHMHQRPVVSVGDTVIAGQRLGIVGSTGNSTGPHLHFEILKNGVRQNPMNYKFYNK